MANNTKNGINLMIDTFNKTRKLGPTTINN